MIATEKLLLVRDPWATLILAGHKSWEIRGEAVAYRGTIAIAKSGEKQSRIFGVVDIVDCIGPLSLKELKNSYDKHRDPIDTRKKPYKKTYAWILANPRMLVMPKQFQHKNGWVKWGTGKWEFSDSDFVPRAEVQVYESPKISIREQFLASMHDDISGFRFEGQSFDISGNCVSVIRNPDFSSMSPMQARRLMQDGYRRIQRKNWQENADEWDEVCGTLSKQGEIASEPLAPDELCPTLELVETPWQKKLHAYCRAHQKIPSSLSIGRQVDLLVWHDPKDEVGGKRHLLGAIGIGSAAYSAGGRDQLFGWNDRTDKGKLAKDNALRCLVQVNCLVAHPPYDNVDYRLTKLFTMAVFSDQVIQAYRSRYKNSPLLAAVSTAGYAGDAHMWDRIAFGALRSEGCFVTPSDKLSRRQCEACTLWTSPSFTADNRRRRNNYIFYPEASIGGPCLNIFSNRTRRLARELCESSSAILKMTSWTTAMKSALGIVGVHVDTFKMPERSLYIGMLDNACISRLRDGNVVCEAPAISWDKWAGFWARVKSKPINKGRNPR
jgi:uncharacterized protein DUF4338/ASCH domain-containing protein